MSDRLVVLEKILIGTLERNNSERSVTIMECAQFQHILADVFIGSNFEYCAIIFDLLHRFFSFFYFLERLFLRVWHVMFSKNRA